MVVTETQTIQELARLCEEETARYRRRVPYSERYCIELFRRALVHGDDDAWEAIYAQYSSSVRRWLGAAPGGTEEEVAATFERFWHAVDAEKFARFGALSAILQYLKMCAATVRIERGRAARAASREEPLDDVEPTLLAGEDVEESIAGRLDAQELWRAVQEALADERQRMVVYLSYSIGLTPREICARHAADFPEVSEVYRLKSNALERLRRATQLQAFR